MAEMHDPKVDSLFNCRGSIFGVDPATKQSWIPITNPAIPIAFITSIGSPDDESSRRELKIIATAENGDIAFEALVMPKTTITKRSQKFCQWADHSGNLYGFGFGTEAELTEFMDKFQLLQRSILPKHQEPAKMSNTLPAHGKAQTNDEKWSRHHEQTKQQSSDTNGRMSAGLSANENSNSLGSRRQLQYQGPSTSRGDLTMNGGHNFNDQDSNNNNVDAKNSTTEVPYPRSQSMFGLESKSKSNKLASRDSPEVSSQSDWQRYEQLKYENERLKQALEMSSKNTDMWHNELVTLRTNNVKLTQALQESKANVEQWVQELSCLRDENKELKQRIVDMGSNSVDDVDYKRDLHKYKSYIDEVQVELKRKESEIHQLERSMEEMKLQSRSNGKQHDSIQSQQVQRLDVINAKFESKLSELVDIQKDLAQVVNQIHQ